MSNKRLAWVSVVMILALVFVTACGGASKKEVSIGTLNNGTYTNDYFGLTVQLPADWNFLDEAAMTEMNKASLETIADGDDKKEKSLDLAMLKMVNLLMASEHPLDGMQLSASVISNAEKVSKLQGIKTGEDYLESAKTLMVTPQTPYEFKDITTAKLGGKDFALLEATISNGEIEITQHYYTAIIEGYAFNIITTFYDDESKAKIDSIVNTISFK